MQVRTWAALSYRANLRSAASWGILCCPGPWDTDTRPGSSAAVGTRGRAGPAFRLVVPRDHGPQAANTEWQMGTSQEAAVGYPRAHRGGYPTASAKLPNEARPALEGCRRRERVEWAKVTLMRWAEENLGTGLVPADRLKGRNPSQKADVKRNALPRRREGGPSSEKDEVICALRPARVTMSSAQMGYGWWTTGVWCPVPT